MNPGARLSLCVPMVAMLVALVLCSTTAGQDKSPTVKWEYRAVSFGTDEKESTKKLNDLAADGWEYVGHLNSNTVAFKRPQESVGLLYTLDNHTDLVLDVAFSPDGQWLLSSSADGTVRLAVVDAEIGSAFRALANELHKEIRRHASRRTATVPAKPGARAGR